VNESLTLDASGSFDPDGDPLTFSWTLGNTTFTTSEPETTLSWSDLEALGIVGPGDFDVAVEVNDELETDVATTMLTVLHATPTLTIVWSGGTYNGSPFVADGSVTGVDGTDLGPLAFTYFVGLDTTGTQLVDAPVNVGTYTVQADFAGDALHTSGFATATITITTRSIEVTADGLTKTYGAADPDLTYRITGGSLAFTDAFFGELAREAGEDVGSYAIRQGSLGLNDNYDLSFVEADLAITHATLTGEATTQDALNTAKQGMLNITVTNIAGFVNGENAEVFLTNAFFWITIGDVKYEFVPTSVTTLSDSSISISYKLKNSDLQEDLAGALEEATSGATSLEAGFAMESMNYSLTDDYLTHLFSTVK
jgi:hypothetical protein